MRDSLWARFKTWLNDAVHGDEWLQPVAKQPVLPYVESIGHCLSYLEGILLRQPENSCPAIEDSLRRALKWYKAKTFDPARQYLDKDTNRAMPDLREIQTVLGRTEKDTN